MYMYMYMHHVSSLTYSYIVNCAFSSLPPSLPPSLRLQQVFRSPVTGYNVLIHLHKKHVPLAAQGVDVAMTTDSAHSKQSRRGHPTHFPVTDFNPAEKYLAELEVCKLQYHSLLYKNYTVHTFSCICIYMYIVCVLSLFDIAIRQSAFSEFCLFFYDKYGGRYIAVVWKPQAFTPQPFRVRYITNRLEGQHSNLNLLCCLPHLVQVMQAFCKTQAVAEKEGKKV